MTENAYFLTDFGAIKSWKGGNCFPVKDDFSKDLIIYFDSAMHKFLGPVLQKVHFAYKWDS